LNKALNKLLAHDWIKESGAMAVVSLTIAGTLLSIALLTKARPGVLIGLGGVMLFFAAMLLSLLLLALAMALFIAGSGLFVARPATLATRVKSLVFCCAGACVLSAIPMTKQVWDQVRMREEFPYLSLRERLQPVNTVIYAIDTGVPLKDEPANRFAAYRNRGQAIADLHRSAVYQFLETPEFGVSRMAYPSLRSLQHEDGSPIRLPDYESPTDDGVGAGYDSFAASGPEMTNQDRAFAAGSTAGGYPQDDDQQARLQSGHQHFGSWFLDPNRFGDVQDVDHVAGFLPHAIVERRTGPVWELDLSSSFNRPRRRKEPADDSTSQLELKRLQLVGLLYHPTPVVYELDTLPQLLNASTAQTRPLDAFEVRALEQLQAGKPIYAERYSGKVRMLGGLRNSSQCTTCHAGDTRQLLGAFSYVLESKRELDGVPLTTLGY
jgi:hypothetical protein